MLVEPPKDGASGESSSGGLPVTVIGGVIGAVLLAIVIIVVLAVVIVCLSMSRRKQTGTVKMLCTLIMVVKYNVLLRIQYEKLDTSFYDCIT